MVATWLPSGNEKDRPYRSLEQDYRAALDWYLKAEDQGEVNGYSNAGRMYKNGKGTPPNPELALQYYRKAVDMGNDRDGPFRSLQAPFRGLFSWK